MNQTRIGKSIFLFPFPLKFQWRNVRHFCPGGRPWFASAVKMYSKIPTAITSAQPEVETLANIIFHIVFLARVVKNVTALQYSRLLVRYISFSGAAEWIPAWCHIILVYISSFWTSWLGYDATRDAVLTCAQKLTRVSLIYRTEPTIKSGKQKKSKK